MTQRISKNLLPVGFLVVAMVAIAITAVRHSSHRVDQPRQEATLHLVPDGLIDLGVGEKGLRVVKANQVAKKGPRIFMANQGN